MSSEAAWRKSQEVAVQGCYAEEANNVHRDFPRTVYYLDIPWITVVKNQCQNNVIFNRWLCKTDKIIEPLRRALFLDPSSFVTSCCGTWWSAIHEFSLHVAPRKHQKRRKVLARSIHGGKNCHGWTPLSWRQRRDPSLGLQGDNFAYFVLNDSETRFVIVESAMGREVNQPQRWLKYVGEDFSFVSLLLLLSK